MSETNIVRKIQPPRIKSQKARLAQHLRAKGRSESDIKRIVWNQDLAPTKGGK